MNPSIMDLKSYPEALELLETLIKQESEKVQTALDEVNEKIEKQKARED